MTLRIAWLTTGRGPGSYGALEYLLNEIDAGLPVKVAVVFVNRARGDADPTDALVAMAEARGIPVEMLSSVAFRKARGGKISRPGEPLPAWRLEYDRAVADQLESYDFALGVMFGYMLIATHPLYSRFAFINDHPALPEGPIGTYEEVIAELIRIGARESGCMMNIVTGKVDRGPVVSFCRYALRDAANEALWTSLGAVPAETRALQQTALYADIRARGVSRERPFLVETLSVIASGELTISPARAADLTAAVEARIARCS